MLDPLKRVLVTGAAGFLGSNLVDTLMENGFHVTGVDNLSMGKRENLENHFDSPSFEFVEADITNTETFDALGDEFSYIVHMAAFKIPRYGKAIDTLRINATGSENVLDFSRRCNAKCVLASTSDVYGMNPNIPFAEDDVCVLGSSKVPRWSYAVSKLFDEHLALAYQDAYGFPVTLLRFFGSYGPRQHLNWWGGAPPVFIDAALNDKEIPVHGDGSQTRSFTYVTDTIAGVYAAMTRDEANGEVINIGSTFEISILELAKMIKRLSNTPGEPSIRLVPYESFTGKRYEDVMRRVPDLTHCQRILNVTPQVGLEEGLRRTIEWQRLVTASERPLTEEAK